MEVLLIDNNDSFTYNLVDALRSFRGVQVKVRPSTQSGLPHPLGEIDEKEIKAANAIIFSPGPGLPIEYPVMSLILDLFPEKPVLGVCLGMQAIAMHFGGKLINLKNVVHGQPKKVTIIDKESPLFKGLPDEIIVGLYHSWAVERESLPSNLIPSAISEDGVLMSIRAKGRPVYAVQFHPESHITPLGRKLLQNWLSAISPLITPASGSGEWGVGNGVLSAY